MNNFFRALIAGYGAKKLGGGCFGTILVFVLIWVALGQCSWTERESVKTNEPVLSHPKKLRVAEAPRMETHYVVDFTSNRSRIAS